MDRLINLANIFEQVFILSSTNLFQDDWVKGNLYEIADITNLLGPAACWIISLVGFLIVIISISKNALSGLYCIWPDFWDKVDEVQTQMADGAAAVFNSAGGAIGGKNAAAGAAVNKIGSFLSFIIGHFPNVKALTDFNGVETSLIDKKQYFMRSLPLMVAQIFIGMFIFFGKPADVANFIGQAGIKGVDIVLANIDPIETVKSLSDKFADMQLATDDSKVPFDKVVNGITRDVVAAITSQHSDLKKNTRQEVAGTIEGIVQNKFSPFVDVIGAEQGWKVSYKAAYNTTQPANPTGSGWSDGGNGVYVNKSDSGIMSYRTFIQVSGINTGKKIDPIENVMVTVNCVPEAVDVTKYKDVRIYSKFEKLESDALQFTLPNSMGYTDTPANDGWGVTGIKGRTVGVRVLKQDGNSLVELAQGGGKIEMEGNLVKIYAINFGGKKISEVVKDGKGSVVYQIKPQGWKANIADNTSNYSMDIASFVVTANSPVGVKVGNNGKVIGSSKELLSALKTGNVGASQSDKSMTTSGGSGGTKPGKRKPTVEGKEKEPSTKPTNGELRGLDG